MTRPPLPPPPYRGGCLCGAVRYEYKARPLGLNACHCIDCKRLTGSSYFSGVHAWTEHFAYSGETAIYKKIADSAREIDIHRCATCGTRLWHHPRSAPQLTFFAAGTLDDSSWFIPTSHIWTRSAQPDVQIEAGAVVFQTAPDDRQVLWDAFDRFYPPEA